MRLALVDDDVDALQIFSKRFRQDGYECDVFETAEAALPRILGNAYDALIFDIRLPGMSGVQLLEQVRQKQVFAPCALITAFNSLPLAKQALNASANYLLEKPFRYDELKRVVERITQQPNPLQLHAERTLKQFKLTAREEEVARLLLKGLSNAEIAETLGISEKTVKQYVGQVFEKAFVTSRSGLFSAVFPL